jgi:hypothetical protein
MPFKYDTPTPAGNNCQEFNYIHEVMDPLHDGGGVYTLGNMAGTVIRGNHIHDNPGAPGGIYLDEGNGFIEVTGNVVYNVRTPMNYNNRNQKLNRAGLERSQRYVEQYGRDRDDDFKRKVVADGWIER